MRCGCSVRAGPAPASSQLLRVIGEAGGGRVTCGVRCDAGVNGAQPQRPVRRRKSEAELYQEAGGVTDPNILSAVMSTNAAGSVVGAAEVVKRQQELLELKRCV